MQTFNVLDRSLDIHRNYLLEASAGTGKTFSIENIVVRLLLEENPHQQEQITLDKILVVTFTRAATRDLKIRIRANIEKSLSYFQDSEQQAPDYLKCLLEAGPESIAEGKKRLEKALFCFDQAQIFTIHAFCSRMLRDNVFEGDVGFTIDDEDKISNTQLFAIIRDYFRTELTANSFSKGQLKIVSKEYNHSTEELEKALAKTLKRGWDIEETRDYASQLKHYRQVMNELKKHYSGDNILADFHKQVPSYKELCVGKTAEIKIDILSKVERFCGLFGQSDWSADDFDILLEDGIILVDAFDPSKLKAKAKPPTDLFYPLLRQTLQQMLCPLVEEAGNPLNIFSRMASGCQKMYKKILLEEEKLGFDDILKTMQQALQNPKFAQRVRHTYKAAIIDEFQDTDPIQWEIFRTLFLSEDRSWGQLYLVGDPKQSIYAFRQADIYTYLSAAQLMGTDHHASLDTNYRSQPSLVTALNTLFAPKASPGLIALPRIGKTLEYRQVNACTHIPEITFSDNLGSVHFCLAEAETSARSKNIPLEKLEEQFYFPFFVQEIQRLHQKDGFHFKDFAILVSDRYQAQRIADFLKMWNIPAVLQRSTSITESPALAAIRELLQAVLHPRDNSSFKVALGGPILGWSHTEILSLDEEAIHTRILTQLYALRKQWISHGFAFLFQSLMQSRWNNTGQTVAEKLLSQVGYSDLYLDLHLIADILIEQESETHALPETLLAFLDQFPTLGANDDDRVKKHADYSQDSVNILTLHSSKGLEFEVVFAIGLVTRSKPPEQLLPQPSGRLGVVLDKNTEIYKQHCCEIDAEKIRQLYVAMTRAKYRLYVPVAINTTGISPELGCASPMELFLARLGQPLETSMERLYERIAANDGKILCSFIDHAEVKLSYAHLQECPPITPYAPIQELPKLTPPPSIYVPGRRILMQSFTTLAKDTYSLDSSVEVPHNPHSLVKTPHTLPSGSETGILLHKILETLSFQSDMDQLNAFIRPHLTGTAFAEWEPTICRMLANALNTELHVNGASFCLANIPSNRQYREMEFLYPTSNQASIEELERKAGYLKGVIDLFFFYQGKYYLLDWKSNWLGNSLDYYLPENLEKVMHEHDYFLQASIYTAALQRYLRLVDRRPFDEIFGGTFYIFLRGLDPSNPSSHGVYFFKS